MPIDLSVLQSPSQAILRGLQTGTVLNEAEQQRITQQLNQQKKAAMMADFNTVLTKDAPTAKDFAGLTLKHPQFNAQFKQAWDMLNTEQQGNKIRQVSDVYAALSAGNTDIAKNLLQEHVTAAENSGDTQSAKAAQTLMNTIDVNPNTALTSVGLRLSAMMGPDKFTETFTKLEESRRATAMEPGELKKQGLDLGLTEAQVNKTIIDTKKTIADIALTNVNAEKVASEIALDRMKLQQERVKGVELTKDGEKLLNESVMESVNSKNLAAQYGDLADSIEAEISISGLAGKAVELVKKWSGDENNVTRLRQDYRRLRNSAVLEMLPPGVASDKDIEVAMSGFPEDMANPQLIASFMRGLQKLKTYDSEMNSIKADWVNNIGNLGSSKVDTTIGDKTIPAGTSFDDFVKENIDFPSVTETDNMVIIDGQQFTRPANFTDEQWQAYKQSQGAQ